MKHPEHGQHICYTQEDVEAHKKIGWREIEEAKPSVEVSLQPVKRGRPAKVRHGD
jgi:hypothetical protein